MFDPATVYGTWGATGKFGLWVYGPRRSGTSTLARGVADLLCADKGLSGVGHPADWWSKQLRDIWTKESLVRANPMDHQLLLELYRDQEAFDALWSSPVVLVDDTYTEQATFWRQHLLAKFDRMVKSEQYVIFAGTWAPFAFGDDWGVAIADLFHVESLGADGGYQASKASRRNSRGV